MNTDERDSVIADIQAAFECVSRGPNGVSWGECRALDLSEGEQAAARHRHIDPDGCWPDLITDPKWTPFPGVGGFAFMNAEGFRYYLPPTMIRMLLGNNEEWFPGHLLEFIERFVERDASGLWSDAQLRSIARFIDFMARQPPDFPDDPNPWQQALDRWWLPHLAP